MSLLKNSFRYIHVHIFRNLLNITSQTCIPSFSAHKYIVCESYGKFQIFLIALFQVEIILTTFLSLKFQAWALYRWVQYELNKFIRTSGFASEYLISRLLVLPIKLPCLRCISFASDSDYHCDRSDLMWFPKSLTHSAQDSASLLSDISGFCSLWFDTLLNLIHTVFFELYFTLYSFPNSSHMCNIFRRPFTLGHSSLRSSAYPRHP